MLNIIHTGPVKQSIATVNNESSADRVDDTESSSDGDDDMPLQVYQAELERRQHALQ
jgi:hypothetical protein